eukprot:4306910-Pyramimonas_sp.AAC.1
MWEAKLEHNVIYLMTFRPSRHRAWVVCLRTLGCSFWISSGPLRGLLKAVFKPSGDWFGASLGPLEAS